MNLVLSGCASYSFSEVISFSLKEAPVTEKATLPGFVDVPASCQCRVLSRVDAVLCLRPLSMSFSHPDYN